MPQLCAFGCKPTIVPVHRFPNCEKFPERFKLWVSLCGGKVDAASDNEYYQKKIVCDKHFTDKDHNRNRRLNAIAVPSLFLSGITACEDLISSVAGIADEHINTSLHQLPMTSLKIALVQLSVGADKSKNIAEAVKEIHKAKQNGAQLVALPECFNSPYGTSFFKQYAEEVPSGETCRALSKAAAEAGVCVVGGTVPERCGDSIYNTCTVWDQSGKLLAQHRKMHLFDIDIPGKITFKESDILSAGDQLSTFEFAGLKVGLGICYDLRFQEMAQLMAKKGCSLLIYPGAFNMTTGPKHWELLGRARATDQQLWVALVSPARDDAAGYVAWGHSTLIDPWGQVVGKLDEKAGTLIGDIDLKTVEEVRSQIPIRTQRRTDIYDVVLKEN